MQREINNEGMALAYITDCTLATVESLAILSKPPKRELERQIEIAQKAINWMDQFGTDYSGTRANDVKKSGGKVSEWAAAMMRPARPKKHAKPLDTPSAYPS